MCEHCRMMERGQELLGQLKVAGAQGSLVDTQFANHAKNGRYDDSIKAMHESLLYRRQAMELMIDLARLSEQIEKFREAHPLMSHGDAEGISSGMFKEMMGGADIQKLNLMEQDQNMSIDDLIKLIQGGKGQKPS